MVGKCKHCTIKLDEDVGTGNYENCDHIGFSAKPHEIALSHVQPGNILFSGLDMQESALGTVLKQSPRGWYAVVELNALSYKVGYYIQCLCPHFDTWKSGTGCHTSLSLRSTFLCYPVGSVTLPFDICGLWDKPP